MGVCNALANMLIKKNAAYGNSALNPLRVFSHADPAEQLRVRIDDKLSRLVRGDPASNEGEDTVLDLMGYLVLLRIATKGKRENTFTHEEWNRREPALTLAESERTLAVPPEVLDDGQALDRAMGRVAPGGALKPRVIEASEREERAAKEAVDRLMADPTRYRAKALDDALSRVEHPEVKVETPSHVCSFQHKARELEKEVESLRYSLDHERKVSSTRHELVLKKQRERDEAQAQALEADRQRDNERAIHETERVHAAVTTRKLEALTHAVYNLLIVYNASDGADEDGMQRATDDLDKIIGFEMPPPEERGRPLVDVLRDEP
jgi:hypothetical protein